MLNNCTILTTKVHLFSQPISSHTTQKNTLGLDECSLYAVMPLILLLGTRKAGEVGWGSESLIGLNGLKVGWYLFKGQYWTRLKRFSWAGAWLKTGETAGPPRSTEPASSRRVRQETPMTSLRWQTHTLPLHLVLSLAHRQTFTHREQT